MTGGPVSLDRSVRELARRYRSGESDPTEVVAESLRRVRDRGTALGAVTDVLADAEAVAADRAAELRRGTDRGPLHGIPVVVKELIDVAGLPRSAGTHVRPPGWNRAASADATVVERLRAAGAVLVARGRTHEFAWGITTRHPDGSGTANPLDPASIAGGSSGGVAALVASGCAPIGIGTDTGGSVRIPATFCGLVGWKPAFDRLPTDGVVALAPAFDTVGVLARTLEDLRAVDAVLPTGLGDRARAAPPVVALLQDATLPTVDDATGSAMEQAGRALGVGIELVAGAGPADWPAAADVVDGYDVLQRADALLVHRDGLGTWPAQADRYGADVAGRLREAQALSRTAIERAEVTRDDARRRSAAALAAAGVDVVLLPAAACGPSPVADPDTASVDGTPVPLRDAVMPFTKSANILGWPALVLPVGPARAAGGPPASVQLLAPPGSEPALLAAARALPPPAPDGPEERVS